MEEDTEINELRMCIITAVSGNYRASIMSIDHLDVDGFVFGSGKNVDTQGSRWIRDNTRYFSHDDPYTEYKYYKSQWHKIPRLDNYDIIVWIDATVDLKKRTPIPNVDSIVGYRHQVRQSTHDEIRASKDARFSPYESGLQSQMKDRADVPWLAITGWLVNRRGPRVYAMNDAWFYDIINYSPQCQVSFPSACEISKVPVRLLNDGVSHKETQYYKINPHLTKYADYRIMSRYCILLTCTVKVKQYISYLHQRDADERRNQYVKTIEHWLTRTKLDIVVVENSGYPFDEFDENERFKKIIINEDVANKEEYLKNEPSKGQHESYCIKFAYENCPMLQNASHIIKITGRFFIPHLEAVLQKNLNMNIKCIRQSNKERCEIVGCRNDLFNDIFDYPKKYAHVETAFAKNIDCFTEHEILKLPNLPLNEITKRGCGLFFDAL